MAATNENVVINPTNVVEAPLGATYMPTRVTTVSLIVLPLDANTINLRAGNIQLLPNFHGLENEKPYEHIKTFEEACSINLDGKMNADTLYLKLFPFLLKKIELETGLMLCLLDLFILGLNYKRSF